MAPFLHDTVGKRAMLRVHDAILADHRRGTVGMLRISWDGIGLWMVHWVRGTSMITHDFAAPIPPGTLRISVIADDERYAADFPTNRLSAIL
jgi:hypothetical protein